MMSSLKMFYTKVSVLVLFVLLVSCSSSPNINPRLEQAVLSFKYMTSKKFLSDSPFKNIYPRQIPSEYLEYIFSTIGSAEWPTAYDEGEEEQLRSVGIPIMPLDIAIAPNRPDLKVDLQIVLKADDKTGMIIIEAYEKAGEDPVLVVKRKIGL
jgi:hypothetical protein